MTELEQKFQKAAEDIKNLKARPSDQDLLEIYALFKQATVGDNTQSTPGMFQLKEKAKHEFWLKKKGMSQDAAKEEYIAKAKSLVEAHGLKE